MKLLICLCLLSATSFFLVGCAHRLVELDLAQLQRQPISTIEMEVAENKIFVQDTTALSSIPVPIGIGSVLVGPLVQYGVNRSRERALNPIRDAMQDHDLQTEFADKLRALAGEPPFSAQMEVSPFLHESTAQPVAKMLVRVTLSKDYALLEVSAWLNYHQNPQAKERYHKTYISIQQLKKYGATGNKTQISKSLKDNPQPLIDSVTVGMQEVINLFSQDLRNGTSLRGTAGETVRVRMLHSSYSADMQVVAESDGRISLSGGRVASQVIAQVPSSWVKRK